MSKKIEPAPSLSDFDKQYLSDRGEDWRTYITAEPPPVEEGEDEDVPYSEWTPAELKTEIDTRNENRETNKIQPASGKKADLVKALEQDDAGATGDSGPGTLDSPARPATGGGGL